MMNPSIAAPVRRAILSSAVAVGCACWGLAGADETTPSPPDAKPEDLAWLPIDPGEIRRSTAARTAGPLKIDGKLDEASWAAATRSPRFADIISGEPTRYDTFAAVLWDDDFLYVGFWIEEPDVRAALTERDAPIYSENDVEVFIAGKDAYYEFEINALGTIYEALFVWESAYESGGFGGAKEFDRAGEGVIAFNGVGFGNHPRGKRIGFMRWDFPGLVSAVHIDGTLNDAGDTDVGWTVELALPWKGMSAFAKRADGTPLPPAEGDVLRMDFSRFNKRKYAETDSGGWVWSRHGVWDSHIPECFAEIRFAGDAKAE